MQFTSTTYFIFLIVVFFAFWLTKPKWRIGLLLLASGCFYLQTGILPMILLAAIAISDFFLARSIHRSQQPRTRKLLLFTSLFVDVGMLCFFKYAGFFALHVIVPLGLSFFIFQSIAYVVDVYRKTTEPTRNLLEYSAFLSFFPSLVAGPINRAQQLLPQLRNSEPLTAEQGGQALFLIALGLIKKIAVADYLRTNFVDRVFDFPERFSSLEMLAAIYGYAIQIYADFSGYSDIAIGSALLLGIALPMNFNAPYRALDLPEFWRRWHITLSTWLRDYVFFSLASLRKRSTALLYIGLIITMLIGGVWHGAAWTFVVWGLLHGVGLAVVRGVEMLRKRCGWPAAKAMWGNAGAAALTFHFVCLTWIFFRADSFPQAFAVFRSLGSFTMNTENLPLPIIFLIVLTFAAQWLPDNWGNQVQRGFVWLPAPGAGGVIGRFGDGVVLDCEQRCRAVYLCEVLAMNFIRQKTTHTLACLVALSLLPFVVPSLQRWRIAAPQTALSHVAAQAPSTELPAITETRHGEIEDASGQALQQFFAALSQTEQGNHITRISHYGDSPITGDMITSTVRRKLQLRFGDAGHGFILAGKPWNWYGHIGVNHSVSKEWQSEPMFISKGEHRFGFGGASFTARAAGATASFSTASEGEVGKSVSSFEIYFLAQPSGGAFDVEVDGKQQARVTTASNETRSGFHQVKRLARRTYTDNQDRWQR